MILRAAGAGVSLGRGHHPRAAADELLRAGLAERAGDARRGALTIAAAGRAHLRRGAAADPDVAFAAQHAEIVRAEIVDETGRAQVQMNAAESPLDWLRRRKDRDGEPFLDAAAFEAGERLRRDLTFGGMLPAVTSRWGVAGGSGGAARDPAGATDAVIAARQRAGAALDAVGRDFADLLIDLCGFLKGLETLERERGWPARSGKVVLRLALRRLAEHLRLESEGQGPGAIRRHPTLARRGRGGDRSAVVVALMGGDAPRRPWRKRGRSLRNGHAETRRRPRRMGRRRTAYDLASS